MTASEEQVMVMFEQIQNKLQSIGSALESDKRYLNKDINIFKYSVDINRVENLVNLVLSTLNSKQITQLEIDIALEIIKDVSYMTENEYRMITLGYRGKQIQWSFK